MKVAVIIYSSLQMTEGSNTLAKR